MTPRRIVAIGLLTQEELTALGPAFKRAWPIDETPCFIGLLEAIDKADRELWRDRGATEAAGRSTEQPSPDSDRT